MKKIIYLLAVITIFACDNSDEIRYSFNFGPPTIPDGSENVSLRPLFGITTMGGEGLDYYTYSFYCDTINPPFRCVIKDSKKYQGKMPPKSETLKPNTLYYWRCTASYKGQKDSTEVSSFRTISLDRLNTRWSCTLVSTTEIYENRNPYDIYLYKIDVDLSFYTGHVMNFTIINDSALRVRYSTGNNDPFIYYNGIFKFSIDTVTILNSKYDFVNFGEYEDNLLTLALKPFNSDTILVYKPNQ